MLFSFISVIFTDINNQQLMVDKKKKLSQSDILAELEYNNYADDVIGGVPDTLLTREIYDEHEFILEGFTRRCFLLKVDTAVAIDLLINVINNHPETYAWQTR